MSPDNKLTTNFLPAQNQNSHPIAGEMVTALLKCSAAYQQPILLQTILQRYKFDYYSLPLTIPYETYLQVAEFLCETLYCDLPPQLALETLGYQLTTYYFSTPTGYIMKNLAAILGPRQGAKTYVSTMSKRFPWATHEIEHLTPTYLRYRVRGLAGTGAMTRGSVKACLEISGAKLKRIQTIIMDKEDWILELEWS